MVGKGRGPLRGRRGRRGDNSSLFSSPDSDYGPTLAKSWQDKKVHSEVPDSDYGPGLGQVFVGQEGAFRGTRSRVATPFNYDQPSPSTGVMSSEPSTSLFQWSDDDGEVSGYASPATVSSVHTGRVSVNMTDSNNEDLR